MSAMAKVARQQHVATAAAATAAAAAAAGQQPKPPPPPAGSPPMADLSPESAAAALGVTAGVLITTSVRWLTFQLAVFIGWEYHVSELGVGYYHHQKTGASSWVVPPKPPPAPAANAAADQVPPPASSPRRPGPSGWSCSAGAFIFELLQGVGGREEVEVLAGRLAALERSATADRSIRLLSSPDGLTHTGQRGRARPAVSALVLRSPRPA